MNLTDYHRRAIVLSVMAELPKVDEAKLRSEIQIAFAKAMSPAARKLYQKSPDALKRTYIPRSETGLFSGRDFIVGDADLEQTIQPFKDAAAARESVQQKLEAAIKGCRTRKQFIDRFPEFSNFAPQEHEVCSTLPAVSNVVADLVKLGWVPKVTRSDTAS